MTCSPGWQTVRISRCSRAYFCSVIWLINSPQQTVLLQWLQAVLAEYIEQSERHKTRISRRFAFISNCISHLWIYSALLMESASCCNVSHSTRSTINVHCRIFSCSDGYFLTWKFNDGLPFVLLHVRKYFATLALQTEHRNSKSQNDRWPCMC